MLKKQLGFTLIELLVTLVVIAIIMLYGAPAFFGQIDRERIVSDAYRMFNYMQSAQEVAVSSGRVVTVIPEGVLKWDGPLIMAFLPESMLDNTGPSNTVNGESIRDAIKNEGNLVIAKDTIFTLPNKAYSLKIDNRFFANVDLPLKNALKEYMLFFPDGVTLTNTFYISETKTDIVHILVGDCVTSPYSIGIDIFNPPISEADMKNTTCRRRM